jgi:ABC-type multidrug transport system ATPase subunit
VIELSNIDVVFTGRATHRALDGVSLSISGSSVTVMLGPNGAGKTTLLRVLARTILPGRGTYRLRGKDVIADRSALRDVAFAHEGDRALMMRCTGRENLELYLARNDVRSKRTSIDRAAERFGLGSWLDKETHLYSKGMRQKLCLMGPLLLPAAVVLLDEPTVGLDAESLGVLADSLRLLRDEGRAVIVATHEIDFASSIFTNVVVLAGGRVLADLDDRRFRSVVGGRRFVVTVRDAVIPALAGWTSERGESGENALSRDGGTPADLHDALARLLAAGIVPSSVSTGEPSFDVVYQRILANAQLDRGLDQVPLRDISPSPVGIAL